MKNECLILAGTLFVLLLLFYGILGYCVFFYYEPRIAEEEARQEGWALAITESEEEYRRTLDAMARQETSRSKLKANLEETVKIEKSRKSLLEKNLKSRRRLPSDLEWRRRTNERFVRAQQALDDFEKQYSDHPEGMTRLAELRRQLETLRARQAEIRDLYEKRDKLMVWPLPLIAPFFEDETSHE